MMSLSVSPTFIALSIPIPKSTVNLSPASPDAALMPSSCWNRSTRNPPKPAFSSEAIFSFVHAETAGAARSGGEEHVVVDNVLTRYPLLFEPLQVLHQTTNREVRWIALAVVAELFADLERGHIGDRESL